MGRTPTVILVLALGACARGSVSDAGRDAGGGDDDDGIDAATSIDGEVCSGDPCSLLDQCGCGAIQVCDLDAMELSTAGTECRDVTVPGGAGANCASRTECASGWSCYGGAIYGQCRRYCDGDDDCGTGGYCIIQVTDGAEPVPGVKICTKACSPTAATANGCPASPQMGCRVFRDDPDDTPGNGDEHYLTDCARAAPGTGGGHGVDCAGTGGYVCGAGYDCYTLVDGGGNPVGAQCRQICELTPGPGVCAGGRTCTALQGEQPVVDGKTYGVCQ
jgi:hypothetical protein